jgi:RNA polymerase sigma-70 factor (ECF subfamily)
LETAEVANITGLREGTVRVRLHRARLALRQELSQQERPAHRRPSRAKAASKPRSCRQIFAALSDYLDGSIDTSFCEHLEKHIRGCSPCEAFLADLEQTIERCRSFEPGCKPADKLKIKETLLAEYNRVLESTQNLRT